MVQPNVRTAVIVAARENRSLSSCMAPTRIIACRVWDTAAAAGRQCGPARVCAGAAHLRGQPSYRTARGSNHLGILSGE